MWATAPSKCECTYPPKNPPVNFSEPNDIEFIAAMRAEVPDLWANVDYFTAHPYAFSDMPFNSSLGRAGIKNYITQSRAIGRNLSLTFPVAISETGWKVPDEVVKARSIVEAYQQVFLPDEAVFAVMPFLLTSSKTSFSSVWNWMNWSTSGVKTRSLEWEATFQLRCSVGMGGDCV